MQTEQLLAQLKTAIPELLGANLVGIYLHGSYVLGGYNEAVSDLDYLIVVKKPLSPSIKQQLMTITLTQLWPLAPAKGLEFHVLTLAATQNFQQPLPFDFHFSKYHYQHYLDNPHRYIVTMHGSDPDLAAHLMILQTAGKVLWGPAIATVFAPVPATAYWDSVKFDIAAAPTQITLDPMYTILNLCRALAYREAHLILSKQAGGKWGLKQLPRQYWPLLRQALRDYQNQPGIACYPDQALHDFATMMLTRLKI
ncbi:aminoglycoside adenylyltransferase domain-containing protein [Lactiplantibacillus fabifermentans]|uniref:Spectinomycin 9-adenylyltransferase n=2 Tax=Lactiplantibacillus fabifermentans TaxID=483011 RepID=A0A0R2NME7_9LACO|nr:aminoglycoside adenylyltransferase domain-containing protein [Lactiplantibacillus fabifermentans]ETY73107.1 adenylyl transferase [Lactiplantibacillus fabifermentans T30PCM01]KRO25552.1 adenylyl transferase [Lactiplantibacillus fabifermentans DSM 21115]